MKPNFIIILTDDQGYGDLSCMGSADVATPHIDAMAADGCRFTSWYCNSPVCSPSRASLLTGRYPARAGVRSILAGHRTATGLPPDVPTLATALKPLGYRTACYGKWHLGLTPESRPNAHGFDDFFGFLAGCVDYYSHIFYWGAMGNTSAPPPTHDLWDNNREVWANGEYLTDMITGRAVDFIRSSGSCQDPFLLYLPYNAPHYPMHAPKAYLDRFPHLPPDRRIMAAMLAAVDDGVGQVVAELKRQGLYENTCIVFMSDNGPSRESRNWLDGTRDPYYGGSSGGFKGHKFSLFEGGIRVPGIISWPAQVRGGQVIDEAAAAMDVFPTLLAAAGGDPAAYDLDGLDILPMLAEGALTPHERLFWELGHQTAVRQGKWKLTLNGQLTETQPPEDAVFLADLQTDHGERTNLAKAHPRLVEELSAAALAWRQEVNADAPAGRGLTSH